jgi:hypothetical protein
MTIEVDLAITVGTSPTEVWSTLEDIESHTEWMADAVAITFRSEHRRGVGTEFECLTRIGPFRTTDVLRVTEWEPAAAMGIDHHGVVTGHGRFTLLPVGPGLTARGWREELRYPWWLGGPLGERLSRPVLVHVWRANLARLREACEALGRQRGV